MILSWDSSLFLQRLLRNVMAFTSTGGGTWGPANQLTAPLLPQLPRHRGPSAPVSLSVERIQFTQKPSEHLTVTALSFSAIHARTLLGPQLPPGPWIQALWFWTPKAAVQGWWHQHFCSVISHKSAEVGSLPPSTCKHLSPTSHSSLAASMAWSFYTEYPVRWRTMGMTGTSEKHRGTLGASCIQGTSMKLPPDHSV